MNRSPIRQVLVGLLVSLLGALLLASSQAAQLVHAAPGPASAAAWVEYSRAGGRRPGDAERLTIDQSGHFELRRTVGSARVGRFAGTLSATKRRSLRTAVASIRSSFDPSGRLRSESVTERARVGRYTFEASTEDAAPSSWTKALKALRALSESLVIMPVSGLELTVAAPRLHAELRHIGSEAMLLAGTEVSINATVVDADDVPGARWRSKVGLDDRAVGQGWLLDLGLERSGLKVGQGEHLVLAVTVDVVDADGVTRPASMTVRTR